MSTETENCIHTAGGGEQGSRLQKRLLAALGDCAPDVYLGRWPTDARACGKATQATATESASAMTRIGPRYLPMQAT